MENQQDPNLNVNESNESKENGFDEWSPTEQNVSNAEVTSSKPVLDLDSAWDAAEAPPSNAVPEGKYIVIVDTVEKKRTDAGVDNISWYLKILEGPYKDKLIFKNHYFTERSLPYIKADFSIMKLIIQPPILDCIQAMLPTLQGIQLKVTRKHQKGSDEYFNVYINEFLGKAS